MVGFDLKFSLNFCVLLFPSAVRVTNERRPSWSMITASIGFSAEYSFPTAITNGLPSSGMSVGNGSRCFSSRCVMPTCRSSELTMKISGLPSPFQSATARSLMPANVGKVFGLASVPSFCWR